MLNPTTSQGGSFITDIAPIRFFTGNKIRKAILIVSLTMAGIGSCFGKELTVAVHANPPKLYWDKDGIATGIEIDLIREIARQENWTLRFVPCEWQACLRAVTNGEIDLLPDVAYTEERSRTLDYASVPGLFNWSIIYRNKHVRINSIFDLNGKRIAVLGGSIQEEYVAKLLENSGINVTLVRTRYPEEGFQMAQAGNVDAVTASQQAGDLQADRHGLSETPIVFQPVKLFFVSAKDHHPDVLAAIDRHLLAWQQDHQSIYFDILKKWGPDRQTPVSKIIWWGLAAATLLFLSALGIAAYLRRVVELRTRELRNSEKSLRVAATVFQSQEAMWVMGPDQRILDVNRAFEKLTGYLLDELIDRTTPRFCLEHETQDYRDHMWDMVKQNGQWEGEVQAFRKDQQPYLARLTMTAVHDASGQVSHYVGTQTDITQQKQLQAETVRLAYYDALTGLPNRRLLLDRIAASITANTEQQTGFALLVIDIDNFKDLNDSLGHNIGDQFLQQIAERLVALTDGTDNVARPGGDEFAILLQGINQADAELQIRRFSESVLKTMSRHFELSGSNHHATCCIGIATMENAFLTAHDMLRRGDLAMYQAKKNGRNSYCLFSVEIENAVSFRTALEFDLRKAIERQEFFLHYQPQVDLQGKLIGVEALLRWQSSERGLVPPGLFIPVAEAAGLMFAIGQWVLLQACRQSVQWQRQRPDNPIIIAVNVSAIQFCHLGFTDDVSQIIEATGANPALLKMELTETMMVDDLQATIAKMHILKNLGISLSLDDFGTGYSSLSQLKRLPIDQLKIDQSFVRDLLLDANDVAIAKSIIALGSALDIDVIAEGVETLEIRDFLATIGCLKYQGYAFGRPGPASQLQY